MLTWTRITATTAADAYSIREGCLGQASGVQPCTRTGEPCGSMCTSYFQYSIVRLGFRMQYKTSSEITSAGEYLHRNCFKTSV